MLGVVPMIKILYKFKYGFIVFETFFQKNKIIIYYEQQCISHDKNL